MLSADWKTLWLKEEKQAQMIGWDFAKIRDRYSEETDLPWDYDTQVRSILKPTDRILDLDTGGGEFLLSLNHPVELTACTEGYPPNVLLCKQRLLAKGIDFRVASDMSQLPFEAESFDLIINRHGDFHPKELIRVLKKGGHFLTQQVGSENDKDLIELLLPGPFVKAAGQELAKLSQNLRAEGFTLLEQTECHRPIRFWDVGALVYYAKIIEWEFPGFTVESCFGRLLKAQALLEKNGVIEGQIHRYLIIAVKP